MKDPFILLIGIVLIFTSIIVGWGEGSKSTKRKLEIRYIKVHPLTDSTFRTFEYIFQDSISYGEPGIPYK